MSCYLFPSAILQALNAIEYLRVLHVIGQSGDCDTNFYTTSCEVADHIHASRSVTARTMAALATCGIIESKKAHGYYVTQEALNKYRVTDVLKCFNKIIIDPKGDGASDRVNASVYDALDVTLEKFLH
jgi:DNA-binding IscR family transcriptional regulator